MQAGRVRPCGVQAAGAKANSKDSVSLCVGDSGGELCAPHGSPDISVISAIFPHTRQKKNVWTSVMDSYKVTPHNRGNRNDLKTHFAMQDVQFGEVSATYLFTLSVKVLIFTDDFLGNILPRSSKIRMKLWSLMLDGLRGTVGFLRDPCDKHIRENAWPLCVIVGVSAPRFSVPSITLIATNRQYVGAQSGRGVLGK